MNQQSHGHVQTKTVGKAISSEKEQFCLKIQLAIALVSMELA
jgi:hypothetical protein